MDHPERARRQRLSDAVAEIGGQNLRATVAVADLRRALSALDGAVLAARAGELAGTTERAGALTRDLADGRDLAAALARLRAAADLPGGSSSLFPGRQQPWDT